jgi:hypothetical protein
MLSAIRAERRPGWHGIRTMRAPIDFRGEAVFQQYLEGLRKAD